MLLNLLEGLAIWLARYSTRARANLPTLRRAYATKRRAAGLTET